MATGDEMVETEGSISSLLIDSLKSSQSVDTLSPEDAAWVDSCLVKNLEISDLEWSSFKDALLEILSIQVDSEEPLSASASNAFPRGDDVEMPPACEGGIAQSCGKTNPDSGSTDEETKTCGDPLLVEEAGLFPPQDIQEELSVTSLENAFLPNYKEDNTPRMIDHFDSGLDISSKACEPELLTADIFRVWDLGIPAEEDELVKELKKALSEGSVMSMASDFDDSGSWKAGTVEPLDNLIAGITDLSLNQKSL